MEVLITSNLTWARDDAIVVYTEAVAPHTHTEPRPLE